MPKYSVGILLTGLTFSAFAFAALSYSSKTWQQIVLTIVLALLTGSALIAVVVKRRIRYFCLGFSTAGWLYLGIVSFDTGEIDSYLLTCTLLDKIQYNTGWGVPKMNSDREYVVRYDDHVLKLYDPLVRSVDPAPEELSYAEAKRWGLLTYSYYPDCVPNIDCFYNIGQLLWTIIFAMTGGSFTSWVRRRWGAPAT